MSKRAYSASFKSRSSPVGRYGSKESQEATDKDLPIQAIGAHRGRFMSLVTDERQGNFFLIVTRVDKASRGLSPKRLIDMSRNRAEIPPFSPDRPPSRVPQLSLDRLVNPLHMIWTSPPARHCAFSHLVPTPGDQYNDREVSKHP